MKWRTKYGHDECVAALLIFLIGIIFLLAFTAWNILWAYSADQRNQKVEAERWK
jgi:hypothetical protein